MAVGLFAVLDFTGSFHVGYGLYKKVLKLKLLQVLSFINRSFN